MKQKLGALIIVWCVLMFSANAQEPGGADNPYAQFAIGNFGRAALLFQQRLEKSPKDASLLYNYGVCALRAGHLPTAAENLKKAIAITPDDHAAQCALGIVHYLSGRNDEAVACLTKSLAISPRNSLAHTYLGLVAVRKGWLEAGKKELETGASLSALPELWPTLHPVDSTK